MLRLACFVFALGWAASPTAHASGESERPLSRTSSLRAQFSVERLSELSRSGLTADRLRAYARLSALGSPAALHQLNTLSATALPQSERYLESKSLLEGLAPHAHDPQTQATLLRVLLGTTEVRSGPVKPQLRALAALSLAAQGGDGALKALRSALQGDHQSAEFAAHALRAHPPSNSTLLYEGAGTPATATLLGQLGSPRALPTLRRWLQGGTPALQHAALVSLCQLGAPEVAAVAERWLGGQPSPARREAATHALACSNSKAARAALHGLLHDPSLRPVGLALSLRYPKAAPIASLLAIAKSESRFALQVMQILAHSEEAGAVDWLLAQLAHPALSGHASQALGQSPAPTAHAALETALTSPHPHRAAARAAVLRTVQFGEQFRTLFSILGSLNRSKDAADVSVAAWGLSVLDREQATALLTSADPTRVAGAARSALLQGSTFFVAAAQQLNRTSGPLAQQVLAVALLDDAASDRVPTARLLELCASNSAAAPLAAFALAKRNEPAHHNTVLALLQSRHGALRAHTALGLGFSTTPSARGLLARLYQRDEAWQVRWATVVALGQLSERGGNRTLRQAARLEPDDTVRDAARTILAGGVPAIAPKGRFSTLTLIPAGSGKPSSSAGARGAWVQLSPALAAPFFAEPDGTLPVVGSAAPEPNRTIEAFSSLSEAPPGATLPLSP